MKKAELDFYAPWLRKLRLDCRCKVTGKVERRRAPAPWRPGEIVWPICSQCDKVVLAVRRPEEVVVENFSMRRLERAERQLEEISRAVGLGPRPSRPAGRPPLQAVPPSDEADP